MGRGWGLGRIQNFQIRVRSLMHPGTFSGPSFAEYTMYGNMEAQITLRRLPRKHSTSFRHRHNVKASWRHADIQTTLRRS